MFNEDVRRNEIVSNLNIVTLGLTYFDLLF